jgi:predicted phage terminase large subunit-like protein
LYFQNQALPTLPANRKLEFAKFFFSEAFGEESSDFHLELFEHFASGRNFADAAPRGHAKTTVSSAEVIYRVVNHLTHYTIVLSDTYSQARDIVDNIKSEFEANRLLVWVYGDLRTDWHWTSGAFTTNTDVRVIARGSGMKVRGLKFRHWRPDFVIVDDVENDEMVENIERRQKLLNWVKKALLLALARKHKQVSIIGTVLHDDSLLNNILKGNYGFAGWDRHRYQALNLNVDGSETSLWPSMFPIDKLKSMRDDPQDQDYMGPITFAQEMQNLPVDEESRIFKREWIYGPPERPNTYSLTAKEEEWRAIRLAENPNWDQTATWLKTEIKQILMAVDPAISEKTTADYFAIFVIGVDSKGEIWELDVYRDKIGDIDVQVDKILEFNREWKPDRIEVEAVAYQAGLARAIQKKAAELRELAPVFPVTPDKDKFRRAVIHSANFAGNLVHLRTDHPLFEALVAEILSFPKGTNDDMLDAYMHACEDLVQRYKTRTFAQKPRGF